MYQIEDFEKNNNDNTDNMMKVLSHIIENIKSKDKLQEYIKLAQRQYKESISCNKLLNIYKLKYQDKDQDEKIIKLLQSKQYRSQSGVLVIAVFTSPYPDGQDLSCKWDCHYCPKQPDQPRSYLFNEPGVRRANANKFDASSQFKDRANQYISMGHPLDKIELLVLGGTWSSYPEEYQDRFIRDIFYTANTFYQDHPRESLSVEEEISLNETANCRIIGVTLETRPDCISAKELKNFRRLGVTRVQMGIQHTNDRILHRINRQCSSLTAIKAIKMLKDSCFKIDIHIMPDLPKPFIVGHKNNSIYSIDDIDNEFSVLESDYQMFDTLINSPDWQTDQWKIYPCEVTDYTRIKDDYEKGIYKPYGHQNHRLDKTPLFELLISVLSRVKPYVRLNRVIRDIPDTDIIAGNINVNMKQTLDDELARRGLYSKDIRNREVKKRDIDINDIELVVRAYEASEGTEFFISYESKDRKILFGFLRLRLSNNVRTDIFPELSQCALVRELHVYGQVMKVGDKKLENDIFNTTQHCGLGTKLLEKAFEISEEHKYEKIAVISGAGVKGYYRKFGFYDCDNFMVKDLSKNSYFGYTKLLLLLFLFINLIF